MKLISILFLFCILITVNSLALGISPAKSNIDFSPNLVYSRNITVHNNDLRDLNLSISLEGPLQSFITVPPSLFISKT